ncbi:MAG: hypothetical protein KAQ66_06875 [Rhodospirillaceae bacterium]|nr:hypothetical protein [Rhodospirillaceae bacterium]
MNAGHQSITDIEVIDAPWNKQVTVQEATYEGGFKMVRLRIKEGKRFTDLELDSATAGNLAGLLQAWSEANPAK